MERIAYEKRFSGTVRTILPGVVRRIELAADDEARLESELIVSNQGTFREHGTIAFPDSVLRFRTLGTGRLGPAGDHGRLGTVIWELDGGTGRLDGASGHITSTFTITADGRVTDEQCGEILLPQHAAAGLDEGG